MKYLNLGDKDMMPMVGLGTWKADTGEVYRAVRTAISLGYRHFDCAPIYQNEKEIGTALNDAIRANEVSREDLWITSKLWNNAHLKQDVALGLEQTLSDLNLEYLDLYLMHWPLALQPGTQFPKTASEFMTLEEAPLAKTWEAMQNALGNTCKHLGVSNFNIDKLSGLVRETGITPKMNQVEMHPFLPQLKLVSYCKGQGIHLTAYSPLGAGDRPAERKKSDEPSLLDNPDILALAEKYLVSPAQILISWQVNRGIAVIPKSTNEGRLAQNLKSADILLDSKDMERISEIQTRYRFIDGSIWTIEGSPYTMEDFWES